MTDQGIDNGCCRSILLVIHPEADISTALSPFLLQVARRVSVEWAKRWDTQIQNAHGILNIEKGGC